MRPLAVAVVLGIAFTFASSAISVDDDVAPRILFSRDGDLFTIAVDGSHERRLTDTAVWNETQPAVSPDGEYIAFVRTLGTSSSIWVRPVRAGGGGQRLTRGWDVGPAWSPEGRHIYFARYLSQDDEGRNYSYHENCGSLFRVRVDRREPARRLTNDPALDSFHSHWAPDVSPDGLRIAFTDANQCSGGTTLFALRAVDRFGHTTSDFSRLMGNAHLRKEGTYYVDVPPDYGAPSWAPDGERLVFIGGSSLYVAHSDGANRRRLTPRRVNALVEGDGPAWSPDGKWIAFTAYPQGNGRPFVDEDIYVIRPDGSGMRRLTRTKARESGVAWLAPR